MRLRKLTLEKQLLDRMILAAKKFQLGLYHENYLSNRRKGNQDLVNIIANEAMMQLTANNLVAP